MITLITLYIETDSILQDAPIYDLQRALKQKPHTETFLHHYLSLALSQFMGQTTGRAWDYHVRLIVINHTQPFTDNQQPSENSELSTFNSKPIVKESAMYYLPSVQTGNGKTLTTINGKTYTLIRHYTFSDIGSFFFIVSGITPLKDDDIAEHWTVIRHNNIYLALYARYFSYHLLKENASAPDNWPNFKNLPDYLAFVGPTTPSAYAQIPAVIAHYAPHLQQHTDDITQNAYHIKDRVANDEPYAFIISTRDLK